jgi:DNA-binding phage protein
VVGHTDRIGSAAYNLRLSQHRAQAAADFLNAASEDDDPKTYLTALKKVVEARGGMAASAVCAVVQAVCCGLPDCLAILCAHLMV